MYAAAGRWDDVAKVRMLMKDRGLKKTLGCSFIEVDNMVHSFVVGDTSHPQSEKIYETLKILGLRKQPNQNLKRLLLLIDIPQKIFISVFAISLIFLDTRKNCKSPPRVCHLEWPG